MGADAIFTLDKGKLTLASYYKMPAAQKVARRVCAKPLLRCPSGSEKHALLAA